MDIQKEREAFEYEFKQTDYYIAHGDLSTLMLCDDQYALDDLQVSFEMWQAAKAQAVPEGYVLVPREMQWHKADDLACLEWGRHVGLFYSENRDMSALQVEEFRLRWCKNKANKIMSDYKAMIEAQEPTND